MPSGGLLNDTVSDLKPTDTEEKLDPTLYSGRQQSSASASPVKEHYLMAHDFLEIQIGNVENNLAPHSELVKLILGLIDLLKVDRAVSICFDWEKQEVLFAVVQLLAWRDESNHFKNDFIITIFKESLNKK